MKSISRQLPFLILATSLTIDAVADDGMEIEDAWIAEAPPVARVMAAYMEIENETGQDRRAVSMQCDAFERAEFHRSVEKEGIASMEHLSVLEIAAGSELELTPGGYHIMLFNPADRLLAGDKTRCSMAFDNGQSIAFELEIRKASHEDHSHHHHH